MITAQSTVVVFGVEIDVEYEYEPKEEPNGIDYGFPLVLLKFTILDSTDLANVASLEMEMDSEELNSKIMEAIYDQIEYGN